MRLLFPAIAAIAALSSASVALAGPGCSGRSHDVTASTEMSPAHEAGPASVALAEASDRAAERPDQWAEVLAFLDATAPKATVIETTLR